MSLRPALMSVLMVLAFLAPALTAGCGGNEASPAEPAEQSQHSAVGQGADVDAQSGNEDSSEGSGSTAGEEAGAEAGEEAGASTGAAEGADAVSQPTDSGEITARDLVAPGALSGPVPSNLTWSPVGSTLLFTAPDGQSDVLWAYEADTDERRVLFDPAGHPDDIRLGSAQWSPQGDAVLLTGTASLWLLDPGTGDLSELPVEGGTSAVAFLPTGDAVSFVRDNDLFTITLSDGTVSRLTDDGSDSVRNATVYNGTLDWVYGEEFATRVAQPAYAWSPEGGQLLFLRTDDEPVNQHPILDYRPIPSDVSYTRYPAAGTVNPDVSLQVLAVDDGVVTGSTIVPEDAEYILPFFTWTPNDQEALYVTLSRDHSELALKAWSPLSGEVRTVVEETDTHWINEFLYVPPVFLDGGEQFLWLSERSGFMHLYLYTIDGQLVRQLTEGDWLIDSTPWDVLTPGRPVHVDPTGATAYFSTTANGPLDRVLQRLDIESGEITPLSETGGFHFAALSGDGKHLAEHFSDAATPPVVSILSSDGDHLAELGRAAGPAQPLPEVSREFVTLEAPDGVELHAQIVKPEGFDPEERYGVVVHWYGGPTLQMVSNRYGATNIFNILERDVLYTQAGFIVWRLDNRGSFGRGHAFETPIAGQLGPDALADQLVGIEHLRSLPYVDSDRIGTDGKSFGGFLTLYALINEPDVFRCGKAGSGPTDWATYDTIYTERYMGTPADNPDGYDAVNLVSRADQIEAEPLIVHGLADTNVHLQNSVNFIEALSAADKPFEFVPLPGSDHHYGGDDLVSCLSATVDYLERCLGSPK